MSRLIRQQKSFTLLLTTKDATALKTKLEETFPGVRVILMETRGLDSFYAERHGLIIGF